MKILAYHQIVQGQPANIHAVTATVFAAQMAWLKQGGYHIVTIEEYADRLRAGQKPEPRSIALTFDDGYRDNYTEALPILSEYAFPATIFLVTAYVGGQRGWGQDPGQGEPLLTWSEVQAMQSQGINFGAHTCTHPDLAGIPLDQASKEIADPRPLLEERLGRPILSFCYPYSSVNPQLKALVQASGYRVACSYRPHYVGHAGTDLYELQRIAVLATDSLADFQAKVQGSLARRVNWHVRRLRARVRQVMGWLRRGNN